MKDLIIKRGLWILLFVLGLAACNNEDNFDYTKKLPSEPSNSVYITDSLFTYHIVWNPDGVNMGSDTVLAKFPVHLTEPALSEMKITIDVDYDLLLVYNILHGTSYLSCLTSDLSLSPNQSTLTIEEGQTRSTDSITVAFNKPMGNLSSTNGYLIPLKIRLFRGTDVGIDYEKRHCYLVVNVTQENGVSFKESSFSVTNQLAANEFYDLNDIAFNLSTLTTVTSDAKVNISVNNALIAAWNSEKGTEYQAIPQTDFNAMVVDLKEGDTQQSGKISYKGDYMTLNDPRGYLVPLEITSVTGDNIREVSSKKVFYVMIDVNDSYCEVLDDETTLGTMVTDRTGYNVIRFVDSSTGAELVPANGGASMKNMMFTDNNSQFWALSPFRDRQLDLTVDLGAEVQNITGLRIEGFQAAASWNIKALDVKSATGQMYNNGIDSYVGNIRMDQGRQFIYIKFSKPVDARYIKLEKITPSSSDLFMRQFYIYTND